MLRKLAAALATKLTKEFIRINLDPVSVLVTLLVALRKNKAKPTEERMAAE